MIIDDLRLIDKYSEILNKDVVVLLIKEINNIYSSQHIDNNIFTFTGEDINRNNSHSSSNTIVSNGIWEIGDVLNGEIPEGYVIKYEAIDILNSDLTYGGISVIKSVYDYEELEDAIGSTNVFKKKGSGVIMTINTGDIHKDLSTLKNMFSDIELNKNLSLINKELSVIENVIEDKLSEEGLEFFFDE